MNRLKIALLLLVVIVAGVSLMLLTRGGESSREPVPALERESDRTESAPTSAGEPAATPTVEQARQRVADARLALQQVIEQRESAEMDLQQSERDVEELERFVEDIEARGEDPADFADEGLAKFQPAFASYQDAMDRLELAEAMEEEARKELAEAEDQLALVLAQ